MQARLIVFVLHVSSVFTLLNMSENHVCSLEAGTGSVFDVMVTRLIARNGSKKLLPMFELKKSRRNG